MNSEIELYNKPIVIDEWDSVDSIKKEMDDGKKMDEQITREGSIGKDELKHIQMCIRFTHKHLSAEARLKSYKKQECN